MEGKPPNKVIGRWGAVGQIHLICSIKNEENQAKLLQQQKIFLIGDKTEIIPIAHMFKSLQEILSSTKNNIWILTFGRGRVSKRLDQLPGNQSKL